MSSDWWARVDRLRRMGTGPLPGYAEMMRKAGYDRPGAIDALAADPNTRTAAVLVLLYPVDDVPHTLLMLRPTYDGVHSAQVSFPGGRREPVDLDLAHTARREFTEETGMATDAVELIGPLSPVYIPPSRSLVTPYLAYAPQAGPFSPDPKEVAELIPVPIAELMRPDVLTTRRVFVQTLGQHWKVPAFLLQGHSVWGATALMLSELRALLARD